ncbi:MAG: hypothetical protein MI742_03380 [Desulfobacterales bacterium]|nr:hypothetical protein [Desulfobacterales bacterium]
MTCFEDALQRVDCRRRAQRIKDVLDKMAQVEVIARGLGVEPLEINRMKRETLRELSSHLLP